MNTVVGILIAVATMVPSWAVPAGTEYIAGGIIIASNVKTTIDTAKWVSGIVGSWKEPEETTVVDPAWQWVDGEEDEFIIEKN